MPAAGAALGAQRVALEVAEAHQRHQTGLVHHAAVPRRKYLRPGRQVVREVVAVQAHQCGLVRQFK
jgi:hypothetical protein